MITLPPFPAGAARSLALAATTTVLALSTACSSSEDEAPSPAATVHDAGDDAPLTSQAIPLLFVEGHPLQGPLSTLVHGRVSAVADFDDDGFPDVAQPVAGGVRMLWNDGKGAFVGHSMVLIVEEGSGQQVLAAEVTGDEKLDLIVIGRNGAASVVLAGKGSRSFAAPQPLPGKGTNASCATVADIDGDDALDLVIVQGASTDETDEPIAPHVQVLVNNGSGKFTDESLKRLSANMLEPFGVAAADIDADGHVDLFFTGDKVPHRLLLNDGTGTFRDAPPDAVPSTAEPAGRIPAAGDIDGDGDLDVFIPAVGGNRVLLNNGGGRLIDETALLLGAAPAAGYYVSLADLDQDGHLDAVVANPWGRVSVYRNDGAGRLFDYSGGLVPPGPNVSDSMSVHPADFDGDGDLDLFVSRDKLAQSRLFMNWYPNATDDRDGDGVPDEVDLCPKVQDPKQLNSDSMHFNCSSGTDCATQSGCTLVINGAAAYLVCNDKSLTWSAARAFCKKRGADLVVIDNVAENEFITSLEPADPWIGLTDAATEGTFVWVDGKTAIFTSWNDEEPNDSGGNEDCTGMIGTGDSAGMWNDIPCDLERPFICEDIVLKSPPDPGDVCDVCPTAYDPDQKDTDGDGVGDACQADAT